MQSPKHIINSSKLAGFTLVELLVVIAIIAILAVVGITIFSNTQQGARDARRKADVDSIAKALEVNKTANSSTYSGLNSNQFASGNIPADAQVAQYSVAWAVVSGATPPPVPTAWATTAVNPTAPSTPWNGSPCSGSCGTVSLNIPPSTATDWTVCALLEKPGLPTPNVYCISNQQ